MALLFRVDNQLTELTIRNKLSEHSNNRIISVDNTQCDLTQLKCIFIKC